MVKKQALVVLVTLVSFIGSAFGLGLGDITVKSNLNDPLDAEIKLLQLQGLTAGEVLPTLASNDDFRRAGVERSFFLSNIQFRVKENSSGDFVVTMTTKQAVREPFLNFLVEVNWPGGRLLKEYTVLLDPPVFDTGLAVDALVVESSSNGASTIAATDLVSTTVITSKPTSTSTAPATVKPRTENLSEGQYRVQRNDTLWEIALKVPGRDGYSPQQVMLAIQDLNPQAFLNGNINRVKAGSVLTLPDGRQISARTLDEAIAEVKAQNSGAAPKLRTPVAGSSEVQLSATESTSSALATGNGDKNPDGYLELTADSESRTATASGEALATIDQLQNQLSVAEELNDQFERERDELSSRVEELQEQIAIMERLLSVQNSDMAQVQQALTDVNEANTDAVDQSVATVEPTVTDTQAQPIATPTPTPVVTPAPVVQKGLMDKVNDFIQMVSNWVLASTTNMAITGGSLLILILLPLYIRSKRSGSGKTLSEMNSSVEEMQFEETEEFGNDLDDDLLSEVEDDFEDEVSDEPETLDAVVEAEMYMAYQKYDQAEEKLKEAFSEHPNRTDVALKLLEVYAETGDASAFNDLENRLALNANEKAEVADLRTKLPIGGATESNDNDLDFMDDDLSLDIDLGSDSDSTMELGSDLDFDLDIEPEEGKSVTQSDDLDFDLDFGEETNSTAVSSTESNEETLTTLEDDSSDLDFSLDLGDLDETSSENELDFSLDDLEGEDLDLESESESEKDDGGLDFSLDMDESEKEADLESLSISSFDETDDNNSLEMNIDFGLEEESDADSLELDSDIDLSSLDELSLEDNESEDSASDEIELDIDEEEFVGGDVELSSFDEEPEFDEPEVALDAPTDALQQLADSLDSDAELEEDEFDFLSGNDEASTKLDLARAYIEMDDKEGARDILEEVASEGSDDQKAQAKELMAQL